MKTKNHSEIISTNFQNYVEMKNISSNKSYCAKLLFNSIGAKTFNVLSSLSAPKQPSKLNYDELLLLETHLAQKRSIFIICHQFFSKCQSENQSIAEYVGYLHTDIGECEWICPCGCKAYFVDVILKTQFTREVRDSSIQEQLLKNEKWGFLRSCGRSTCSRSNKTRYERALIKISCRYSQ